MNAHPRDIKAALPDATESEQSLLGAIFLDNSVFWQIAGFLTPAHFHLGEKGPHGLIFKTIGEMMAQGRPVSPLTIKPYIPADELIGERSFFEYVISLQSEAVGTAAAYESARAVLENWARLQLIGAAEDLDAMARNMPADQSPEKIIGEMEARLSDVARGCQIDGSAEGTIAADVDAIIERFTSDERKATIPLPLPQLTELLSGDLEVTNLYGLLSGSGEGKTSLMLQIVDRAATDGHPVILLEYDQTKQQIIDQIVSQRTGIENTRIRNRTMMEREIERYLEALKLVKRLPLRVIKCNGATDTAAHLVAKVKRIMNTSFRSREKPALVVVDHARKVKPRDERAHEGRIAADANGLFKQAAVELECVWLNLMQRSATGTKRKNPRPIDSDIYGGEQGREDYDAVFYLYRAWKYWQNQIATAEDEKEEIKINARFQREKWTDDQAELGVLKWRFGDPTRRFKVRFEAPFTRYVSMRTAPDPAFDGMDLQ